MDSSLVLWGQSLGAGVAAKAAAERLQADPGKETTILSDPIGSPVPHLEIKGMILETPFTSVKDMLAAIYPQTWLPYRYLWPFLRSHWNSRQALNQIFEQKTRPRVLIVQAGKDELVPPEHGEVLERVCNDRQIDVNRKVISEALHHEILFRSQGRAAVVNFLEKIGKQS